MTEAKIYDVIIKNDRLLDKIMGAPEVYNLNLETGVMRKQLAGMELHRYLHAIDTYVPADFNAEFDDVSELFWAFSDAFNRWEDDKGCV